MNLTVTIGATRAKLIEMAEELLSAAQRENPARPVVQVTFYAENNNVGGGEVVLDFGNDDMERPEMANKIIVDVAQS